MNIIARYGRTLLLSAVLAVGSACVSTSPPPASGGRSGGGGAGGYDFSLSCGTRPCRTVKMPDGKTWTAENLNYQTGNSWCYNDDNSNCGKYGRLYDWNTAAKACPAGWRLPSREEWGALAKAAGGEGDYGEQGTAGKALKSTSGWDDDGNGIDSYGYSALPGGTRLTDGTFNFAGKDGYWWTATESAGGLAYYRDANNAYDYVDEYHDDKNYGISVRCVKD